MNKHVAATIGHRVLLLDSITWIGAEDAGAIVISGSHGGRSAGEFVVLFPLALCCLNDAGVGKDRAGIVALDRLDERGVPGVAFSHDSANEDVTHHRRRGDDGDDAHLAAAAWAAER